MSYILYVWNVCYLNLFGIYFNNCQNERTNANIVWPYYRDIKCLHSNFHLDNYINVVDLDDWEANMTAEIFFDTVLQRSRHKNCAINLILKTKIQLESDCLSSFNRAHMCAVSYSFGIGHFDVRANSIKFQKFDLENDNKDRICSWFRQLNVFCRRHTPFREWRCQVQPVLE